MGFWKFFIYVILGICSVAYAQLSSENFWTAGLEVSYESFKNWGSSVNTSQLFLVVHPKTSQQVASIVTWAYNVGKKVRVQGYQHSYSPITVDQKDDSANTILIDMKRHMKRVHLGSIAGQNNNGLPTILRTVIAEPGISMEEFLTFSERNGLGIVMAPVIGGDATLGGVLAVGAHGAAIPARNEKLNQPGFTFGSVSNSIAEIKAIVWDERTKMYVVKTFSRSHPDIGAFIVHLGRAIITEVTMLVGSNYNMQCVSRTDVPASELFAHPNSAAGLRTMTSYMDQVGRVDTIWFPFTANPWLKLWSVEETKPARSVVTNHPYNYQFATTTSNPQTPGHVFGPQALANLEKGLTETNTWDIWGASKNTILQSNQTASPLSFSGLVVVTTRSNSQLVLHELTNFYTELLNEYASRGQYPIDCYIKLRVTGLDDPKEISIPGAVPPLISPITPVGSRNFNVGVWLNTLSTTHRPGSDAFFRRLEQFAYTRFNGNDALARPEWSKNWGHSDSSPFSNQVFLRETIPIVFGIENWNKAISIFNKYDPHQVITNTFLTDLMVPSRQRRTWSSSEPQFQFGWGK